jgi:hypothetical protein
VPDFAPDRFYLIGTGRKTGLLTDSLNRIEFTFDVSDFIPAGNYQLKIEGPDTLLPPNPLFSITLPVFKQTPDLPQVKVKYADNGRTPMLSINGRTASLTHLFTTDNHLNQTRNLESNQVMQYWLSELQFDWQGPGKYDFSPMDWKITELLQMSPQSYILLQIPVDTFLLRSFDKWTKLYPDETVRDEKGSNMIEVHGRKRAVPSWGSDVWRNEIKTMVTALVSHVRKQPYASQIIGFMPIAGLGAEWMYYGAHDHLYVDYSKPFLNKFQQCMKERYGTLENLNLAWKSKYKTFSEITLPAPAERDADDKYTFIDPENRMKLIDFRSFFSDLVSGIIDELGQCVKTASAGRSLYGTYYGYITYTAVDTWSENGHFALRNLLNSPNVDFLVSLVRYDNRFAGGESGSMTPVNSYILHGKAAVLQSDLRTHRATNRELFGATSNLHESAEVLKRELAWAFVSGAVFEFGYYGKGWIAADSRLMELIGRYQQLEKQYGSDCQIFSDTARQVALIVDDYSVNYILQKSPYHRIGIRELIRQLPHAGTGFDVYLLSDLPRIADRYRCFIFANTYLITLEQMDFIKNKLQKGNRTLIWLHAPGITDGKSWSPERVSELTGIESRIVLESVGAETKISVAAKYLQAGNPAFVRRGKTVELGPRIIPQNAEDLAVTADGKSAVARKKFPEWTSIYAWVPNLSPAVLREVASGAGLTIIDPEITDSVYAAGRVIAVHTADVGGQRNFNVPGAETSKLVELFTQIEYPVKNGICEIKMEPKTTYLFLCR